MEETNCLSRQDYELITIDDPAARVREDAVGCRKTAGGDFELTVAITDTTELLNAYNFGDPKQMWRKINRAACRRDFSLDETGNCCYWSVKR